MIKRVAVFHRKPIAAEAKRNNQAPTVRMPDSLVGYLWRWHDVLGHRCVVEFEGKPV